MIRPLFAGKKTFCSLRQNTPTLPKSSPQPGRLRWCYLACNWYAPWWKSESWSYTLMNGAFRRASNSPIHPHAASGRRIPHRNYNKFPIQAYSSALSLSLALCKLFIPVACLRSNDKTPHWFALQTELCVSGHLCDRVCLISRLYFGLFKWFRCNGGQLTPFMMLFKILPSIIHLSLHDDVFISYIRLY